MRNLIMNCLFHLHFLATEVYKSINELNPQFMSNYFNFSTLPYELRKGNKVNLPKIRSCRYWINSLLFRGALQWNNLARNVKESHSMAECKEKIKKIGNLTCSCVVCNNLGNSNSMVIALLHYATDIIRICSEILFNEGLCRVEASHFICNANRLTGFCMERSFTGKCYRTDRNLFLFTCFAFCFREVRDRLDIRNIFI